MLGKGLRQRLVHAAVGGVAGETHWDGGHDHLRVGGRLSGLEGLVRGGDGGSGETNDGQGNDGSANKRVLHGVNLLSEIFKVFYWTTNFLNLTIALMLSPVSSST